MSTDQQDLLTALRQFAPYLVVIESCGLAGWVHDLCVAEGYQVLVCNRAAEELAVLFVMLRFVQLVKSSLAAGQLVAEVPVRATAHDFDIVGRFEPH